MNSRFVRIVTAAVVLLCTIASMAAPSAARRASACVDYVPSGGSQSTDFNLQLHFTSCGTGYAKMWINSSYSFFSDVQLRDGNDFYIFKDATGGNSAQTTPIIIYCGSAYKAWGQLTDPQHPGVQWTHEIGPVTYNDGTFCHPHAPSP